MRIASPAYVALATLTLSAAVGAQQPQRPRTNAPNGTAGAPDTTAARLVAAERREDPRYAPDRKTDGGGPYKRLIVRGATLIDGTGGPPRGPVDIVIEGNRIAEISNVGTPGVPFDSSTRRPRAGDREIDAKGMYVMPGIVDLHVHQGTTQKAPESEYYNKLWLGHGVTTVRGVPFASFEYGMHEKERSAKNEIAAPRYVVYQRPGTGWGAAPSRRRSRRASGCAGSPATAATASSSAPSGRTSWRRCSTRRRSSASARRRTCSRRASRR